LIYLNVNTRTACRCNKYQVICYKAKHYL